MTVLVTGAAGGIGRAIWEAFGEGDVIAQDLTAGDADRPVSVVGDLLDPSTLDAIEKAVTSSGLDAVVAAHGVAGAGDLLTIRSADVRRIMRINFESVVLLWERVAPLLEASDGSFVVVSSQAGLVSEAANGVYSASKSALAGWLRGMAGQTSVRLRTLYPGATNTPLLESALRGMAASQGVSYEDVVSQRNAATPAGRMGDPRDMGAAVRWLTTLEARHLVEIAVTGAEVLH